MTTLQQAFLTREELEQIPKELRLISLSYALGRATFSKEEVAWLFNTIGGRQLSIFYNNGKEAKLFNYRQSCNRSNELLQFGWMQLRHYPRLGYREGSSSFNTEKQMLYNKLIGRLDTNTVRIQSNEMMDNPGQSQANIVLADIHSVFLIMCRRYESVPQTKRLAVDATKEVLNNIVKYYGLLSIVSDVPPTDEKLLALLIYLTTSAEIFKIKQLLVDMKGNERGLCHRWYKKINKALDTIAGTQDSSGTIVV